MTSPIQKHAQEIPAPYKNKNKPISSSNEIPKSFVGPVQRHPASTARSGNFPNSSTIQQMQLAIQNLYQTFKNYPMFSMKPDYRESDTGQKGAVYGENYEHGSDTFLTNMLNRHVAKSDLSGSQDIGNKNLEAGKFDNLIKLIETLNTFSKGSTKPDGAWGLYTNNALKNLYAIVQAMLTITNKLDVKQDAFTDGDLQDLKTLIPQDQNLKNMSVDDANKLAIEITKNIAKIKILLGSFVKSTTSASSKYAPYINQQKAFETSYGKKPTAQITGSRGYEQSQVPVLNVMLPRDPADNEQGNIPLLLGNIANKDSFMQFVKQNGITVDGKDPLKDQSAMNELLSFVENKIKSANVSPTQPARAQG